MGCRYGIESDITMKDMRQDFREMSSRIDNLQKTVQRRKDITSFYIRNFGSM
jgi:hypothetical protein